MNVRQPVTGGLQLPATAAAVGVAQSEQTRIHNEWDTIKEIESDLGMKGFIPMDTPLFEYPHVTEETLTTPDTALYSKIYAQQLAWFNYSSQVLGRARAEILQVENEMTIIESKTRRAFRQQMKMDSKLKMTKDEMQDEINLDPRYYDLKKQQQRLQQYIYELVTYVNMMENSMKVTSRQVEIKKLEADQTRTNIPGRGYGIPRTT